MNTILRNLELYPFSQFLKLVFCLIKTRIFYPKAKMIRFPFDIRGEKFILYGRGFVTGYGCRLEGFPVNKKDIVLRIGVNVQINDYVHITAMRNVRIGDNVLIASKVYISDSSHGHYSGSVIDSSPESIPKDRPYMVKNVAIGNNVWLGEHVSVLPGVSIGNGTIVGANSVVTKDLPANVIAVGIPAKPIKKYNFQSRRWERIK